MADFIKIPDKTLYESVDNSRLKVKIGGSTDYFAPSVNFSYKLESGTEKYFINICDDETQIVTDKVTETVDKDLISVRVGDVESTFKNDFDRLKIERIFYTKPTEAPKYKIKANSNIKFYYQPKVTLQEIIDGCSQEDNVPGSYAIYCDKRNHYKDRTGKTIVNYETGKLGHLYAPYWTDAVGKKIKGVQLIKGNIQSLGSAIYEHDLIFDLPPQEWLNDAVLPIILDPDIGTTTDGSNQQALSANIIFMSNPASPISNGDLDDITAWVRTYNAGGRFTLGLVTVSGTTATVIDDGVGDTTVDTGETRVKQTQNYNTGESVSSDTTYYNCINSETVSTVGVGYDSGVGTGFYDLFTYSHGSLGTSHTSITTYNHFYAIYSTYTASGGSTLLPIHSNQKRIVNQTYLRR